MKLAVEIAAVQTSIGESRHQISALHAEVAQNAAELQQTVGRYSGVAGVPEYSAPQPISAPPTKPEAEGAEGRHVIGAPLTHPAAESDPLQGPIAARLDFDNPPGPPAGTALQDRR
jgi:hypothetical protein